MILRVNKKILRPFGWLVGYSLCGVTLPFVALIDRETFDIDTVIAHHKIALRQQFELLVVGYYAIILFEFLRNKLIYRMESLDAYANTSLARECFLFEQEKHHTTSRKLFNQWRLGI